MVHPVQNQHTCFFSARSSEVSSLPDQGIQAELTTELWPEKKHVC